MSFPHSLFVGPPQQAKALALDQRIRRLERITGIGRQRAYRLQTHTTELLATQYGILPFLDIDVEVPAGAWVTFFGGAEFDIPDTVSGDQFAANHVYGSIFETTDTGDPFYNGVEVFHTYKVGGASTGQTQFPSYGFKLRLDPNSVTGGVKSARPWVYVPPNSGNKTYRLDFRISMSYPNLDHIYLTRCWFGAEIL